MRYYLALAFGVGVRKQAHNDCFYVAAFQGGLAWFNRTHMLFSRRRVAGGSRWDMIGGEGPESLIVHWSVELHPQPGPLYQMAGLVAKGRVF